RRCGSRPGAEYPRRGLKNPPMHGSQDRSCSSYLQQANCMLQSRMNRELIRPILTVDVVPFTLRDGRLHVVLHRRPHAPHGGRLALIGGYVRPQEDATTFEAAARVLRDKAGLAARLMEQLMTFSGDARDPRGWSLSVAYYGLMPIPDDAAR